MAIKHKTRKQRAGTGANYEPESVDKYDYVVKHQNSGETHIDEFFNEHQTEFGSTNPIRVYIEEQNHIERPSDYYYYINSEDELPEGQGWKMKEIFEENTDGLNPGGYFTIMKIDNNGVLLVASLRTSTHVGGMRKNKRKRNRNRKRVRKVKTHKKQHKTGFTPHHNNI